MAIVVYKCTVCDREIQLIENPEGFERVNQCIITNECRGTLYRVDRLEDFAVGQPPLDVPGLTNYIQRKVLFNHEQSIPESVWIVVHNLGVNPTVQTVVDRSEEVDGVIVVTREEIEPELIEIIDSNTMRITFDRTETGIAQFIARSSAPNKEAQAIETTTGLVADDIVYFQVSNDGTLTIAVDDEAILYGGSPPDNGLEGSPPTPKTSVPISIFYIDDPESFDITAATEVVYDALFPPVSSSPWNDADFVFANGKRYTVRTITYGDPVNDEGVPNGTTVFLQQLPTTEAVAPNSLFLLSLSPYTNVDKDRRNVFRPAFEIGPTQTVGSFIFGAGEFSVDEDNIEAVFPPVYVIPD